MSDSESEIQAPGMAPALTSHNSSESSESAESAPEQKGMEMAMMAGDDIFGDGPITLQQEFAALELCGCEAKNRYKVKGASAGDMYIAEQSDCFERICCGPQRSLTLAMHMGVDTSGAVVLKMRKPFHIQSNCPCCRPHMDVYDANGESLGYVHDPCRLCWMDNEAYDAQGNKVFTASGCPCQCGMVFPCCFAVKFPVKNHQTGSTGELQKIFGGLGELCLNLNRFKIIFPPDTDANGKSLLLAQMMLIDFQYFEINKNDNQAGA